MRSTRQNSNMDNAITTRRERKSSNDKSVAPITGNGKPLKHPISYTDQSGDDFNGNRSATADSRPQEERRLRQQQKRKVQFDALHKEMELVSYSVSETGQSRRVMPRHLSIERTKKRRLLEKQERNLEANSSNVDDSGGLVEANAAHRIVRGPKAAAEDHIVEASLVFGAKSLLKSDVIEDESDEEMEADIHDDDDDENDNILDAQDEIEDEGSDNDSNEVEEDVELEPLEDEDVGETGEVELLDLQSSNKSAHSKKSRTTTVKFPSFKRKKTTRLQRLKNFKSTRMAEKHGAALGAHIQGKSDVAIRKLKQIAARVPLAPQIYSSLGMVYEDLLQDSQQKGSAINLNDQKDDAQGMLTVGAVDQCLVGQDQNLERRRNNDDPDTLQAMIHDKAMRDQLNLARKAYGSYHVAAILYKRDFSLWLRAADSAYEIANVHTSIMKLPDISDNVIEYHRAEKKYWLNEAKNDYQAADNLHPPGIEIPAKLAHVMIELGMLSEALTLLTGLKSQAEFNGSYRAWLLFADLMLRIGHECNQYNDGIQTNNNKMFRRWLRKWSTSFNWKERRMQALVKALEAACGTMCCRVLMSWIRIRVVDITTEDDESHLMDSANTKEVQNNHPESSSCEAQDTTEELPLTASCFTVYSIASELMRQMLDMQLYYGGTLVGDAVSLYLKRRQEIYTDRRRKEEEFDVMQKRPITLFAMQPESYDIDDDDDQSIDVESFPISDDEDWDGDVVTPIQRQGTLPPEIRFLYGLCLSNDDGKIPLAAACIQSLFLLPLENASYFTETVVDYGVTTDPAWSVLHEIMTQPIGRILALSIVTDELRRCPFENELQKHLITLFVQSTCPVYEEGWLDRLVRTEHNASIVSCNRREMLMKVLINAERNNLLHENSSGDSKGTREITSEEAFMASLTKLTTLITTAWRVHHNGSLDSNCIDAIHTLNCLLKLYIDRFSKCDSICKDCGNVVNLLFNIFSTLCGITDFNKEGQIHQQSIDLTAIPINSSWLTNDLEVLSTKAFNLCVGLNINNFSGWQMDKFSMKARSVVAYSRFFGVSTDEGPISGFIPEVIEREINRNWDLVYTLYPDRVPFDFKRKLEILKSSDWHKECREKYHAHEEKHQIFEFAEDRGLIAILNFAYICLMSNDNHSSKEKLHAVALSILLPVTQFILKEKLWDANIGNNVVTEIAHVQEWLDASRENNNANRVAPSQRPGYIRPSKRQLPLPSNSSGEIALSEWFRWEDVQHPKSNLFNISLSILAQIWNQSSDCASEEANLAAIDTMKDIDDCTAKLKLCFTVQAAEQLSVIIATSLLKLLEHPVCWNPFAVVQLATMFASQGPKGGSSDHLFRARLPKPENCTCNDALLILGRAECMNALHFCPEAAFLCSYVVNVCRYNCDCYTVLQEHNRRWLVLSILAYDLSITIRLMAKSTLRYSTKREDTLGAWADVVVEWFRQIRQTNHLKERVLSNEFIKPVAVTLKQEFP